MTPSDIDIDTIREFLTNRRRDIMSLRRSADRSWHRLHEPEIEAGEVGAKNSLAQGLEQLDENSRREIEQIDQALVRINEGRFGRCEACGGAISTRRLQVMPWTPHCKSCAQEREQTVAGGGPAPAAAPPGVAGSGEELTDAEIQAAVEDALQRDGRVETEELRISSRDGVVRLEGVLPAESSRRRLREIIENVLDFKKVEDRLAIDRTLWEQRNRSRGRSAEAQKKEDETLMEGERPETDPFAAKADGKPMAPPDTLQPEKKK